MEEEEREIGRQIRGEDKTSKDENDLEVVTVAWWSDGGEEKKDDKIKKKEEEKGKKERGQIVPLRTNLWLSVPNNRFLHLSVQFTNNALLKNIENYVERSKNESVILFLNCQF